MIWPFLEQSKLRFFTSVSLIPLQVFTSQRVEYSGGQFYGNENQAPTKTLLSFFLSSMHGSYEDLVCFIPTTSLTSASLLHHFNMVFTKIQAIGFDVKLVLTDGHKTNIKFFTELGKGCLELLIQNSGPESSFFTMFDSVHIFKNFYNNFQRMRCENLVLVVPCSFLRIRKCKVLLTLGLTPS